MKLSEAESADAQFEAARRLKEHELKIRSVLKLIVDDNAFERLSLMRVSNESLYVQVASYLFSLYNAGKIRAKVNEEQLKSIASMFLSQKKETKIVRMPK